MKRRPTAICTTIPDLLAYLELCTYDKPVGFDVEGDIDSYRLPNKKGAQKKDPVLMATTAKVVGFSLFTPNAERAVYVPLFHKVGRNIESPGTAFRMVYDMLLDRATKAREGACSRTWIHNLGFELQCFRNAGWDSFAVETSRWLDCSQMASYVSGQYLVNWAPVLGLKDLCELVDKLPKRQHFEDVARGRQASEIPVAEIAQYAAWDAFDTCVRGEAAYKVLEQKGLVDHYRDIDMPCIEVVRATEESGVDVDVSILEELAPKLEKRAEEIREEFFHLTDTLVKVKCVESVKIGTFKTGERKGQDKFKKVEKMRWRFQGADVSKDQQIQHWLYDVLGWWPTEGLKKNKEGCWSTGREVLESLVITSDDGKRALDLVLEYREVTKLLGTYVRPLGLIPSFYPDGRLHTRFNLCGTKTQRLSSSNPNLQNAPSRGKLGRAIRMALKRFGKRIGVYDLSQAELRYAAHLSRDPELMRAYNERIDIHAMTLEGLQAFRPEAERTDAKVVNFSSLYGITAPALAAKMRSTVEVAQVSLDAYFAKYKRLQPFIDWTYDFVIKNGYMCTVDGFQRPLYNKQVRDWRTKKMGLRWDVYNQCPNTAIQGSVGGHVKIAWVRSFVELEEKLGPHGQKFGFIAQEHDALVVWCDPGLEPLVQEVIVRHMETAVKLRVPMVCDVHWGSSWGESKWGV